MANNTGKIRELLEKAKGGFGNHKAGDEYIDQALTHLTAQAKQIKQLEGEKEGLELFIACNYKGTFANCKPECCVSCHKDGSVAKQKEKEDG